MCAGIVLHRTTLLGVWGVWVKTPPPMQFALLCMVPEAVSPPARSFQHVRACSCDLDLGSHFNARIVRRSVLDGQDRGAYLPDSAESGVGEIQ